MISAKFLLGGKQQIICKKKKKKKKKKKSNFDIFESALYTKSVSMPLMYFPE